MQEGWEDARKDGKKEGGMGALRKERAGEGRKEVRKMGQEKKQGREGDNTRTNTHTHTHPKSATGQDERKGGGVDKEGKAEAREGGLNHILKEQREVVGRKLDIPRRRLTHCVKV
jgi:hypothetical protein